MMRASIFRLTPLLLLAAMLMAASVLLVHNARPAAAHHGLVWSATLTEPDNSNTTGCTQTGPGTPTDCSVALTEDELYIPLEPHSHTVVTFQVFDSGTLQIQFDNPITSLSQRPLTLTVDGRRFHSEDGSLGGGGTALLWRNTGLGWDDGDTIALSLEQREHISCDGNVDSSLNPTDLRAFDGNGVLTLAWLNPDTDRGFGYLVRWRKDGTTAWLNPHGAVGEYSYTQPRYTHDITGLEDGASYEAQVRIVLVRVSSTNDAGRALPGGCSEWVSVTGTTRAAVTPIWSATLTVQDISGETGCDNSLLGTLDSAACRPPSGALTDNTFTYGGVDYEMSRMLLYASGTLNLELSEVVPQSLVDSLALLADGVSLSNSSLIAGAPYEIEIPNSGLSWSPGDSVSLSLLVPPPPTAITVTSSGALLEGGSSVNVFFTLDNPALAGGGATLGADIPAEDPPGDTLLTRYWVRWLPEVVQGAPVAVMQMYVPEDDDDNNCREREYSATFERQVAGDAYLSVDFSVSVVDNDGAADTGCTGQISGSGGTTGQNAPCDNCGTEGDTGVVAQGQGNYADLIARMKEWRNDPQWSHRKSHTDRWDRALLAFGETVADTSLTAMTAAEAQTLADSGLTRWVDVAAALWEIEGGGQQQPNQAPTVASAIADATIVSESGTQTVSLSGVFSDADGDSLSISAASDDEATATASVSSDGSSLTVTARLRGTATITVTADDGSGGRVSDRFTVTVKAAPMVASAIGDVSGLEEGSTRVVSLSGVFIDADGDALTITASSNDEAVATVSVSSDGSTLTLSGVAEGTATVTVMAQDSDGNRVSDAFGVSVSRAPEPDPAPTPTPTPEPTPTPTPTPEPEPEMSDIVARYDANGNGKIDLSELQQAFSDYTAGKITYEEMMEVSNAYARQGSG